ncbi:hypothetical protein [Kitasatospora sp. NPDC091207]|uniref:hypothetical protein n=1 Tax=Kitasatospora sp. NPDC091207 TaxID=3364083 RepID=UPI003822E696
MRANHAAKAPEPVRPAVVAARRPGGRWLPRPRVLAAGGALLAQLWGLGAATAYAAAGPLPEPVSRTVGRTLDGGPVLDGGSAEHSAGTADQGAPPHHPTSAHSPQQAAPDRAAPDHAPAGQPLPGHPPPDQAAPQQAAPGQAASPGVLGQLTDPAVAAVPVPGLETATAPVGSLLQDRIRAGGLPLPGQRASLPDAFAIASGLLGPTPAQTRATGTRASRDGDPGGPAAEPRRAGGAPAPAASPAPPAGGSHGTAAPPPAHDSADHREHAGRPGPDGGESTRAVTSDRAAARENPTVTDTAATPAGHGLAGTGTAVLAPITAGLLLTGAAMCKHRGLPRGH